MEIVDWESAELAATIHLRWLGFSDARVTPRGADGGVDVRGSGFGAQVKYYSKPVGSPDVQRIRGAVGVRDRAIFYALSGYTKAAFAAADVAHVALFTFTRDGSVDPVNAEARALANAHGQRPVDLPIAERSRVVLQFVDRAMTHARTLTRQWHAIAATKQEIADDLNAALGAIKAEARTLGAEVTRARPPSAALMADLEVVQERIASFPRQTELRYALSHLAWLADDWARLQARASRELGQPVLPIPGGRGEAMSQHLRADAARHA